MQEIKESPLIEFRNVEKHFGDLHVLKNINLSVFKGEVVAIVGPSGSGKSTLCRTINRLETIDGGEIYIEGKILPSEGKALARLREEIGMVFQSFNLFPHRTILDNVTLAPIHAKGIPKAQAKKEALEFLERVGVKDQAKKVPSQLSGGQQQRVAIARALAMHPKAILFDEPTSALDPEMIGEVLSVIRSLANEGRTMVIVTHEMNFAKEVADRIVFMDGGTILSDSSPDDFFNHQENPRILAFLKKVTTK